MAGHAANPIGNRLMEPLKILNVEIARDDGGRLPAVARVKDLEQGRLLPAGQLLLAKVVEHEERDILQRENSFVSLASAASLCALAKTRLDKPQKTRYACVTNTHTHSRSVVCDGSGKMAFPTAHWTKAIEPPRGFRGVCKCRRVRQAGGPSLGQGTPLRGHGIGHAAIGQWPQRAAQVERLERTAGEIAELGVQSRQSPCVLLRLPISLLLTLAHTRQEPPKIWMAIGHISDDISGTFTTTDAQISGWSVVLS